MAVPARDRRPARAEGKVRAPSGPSAAAVAAVAPSRAPFAPSHRACARGRPWPAMDGPRPRGEGQPARRASSPDKRADASDLHDALALLGQPIAYHRPGLWLTLLPRSHGVGRHDQIGSLVPSRGFNESAEISQVLDSCNWVSSSSVVLRGCRSPSLLRSPSSTPDATRGSRADARRPSRSAHPQPRTQFPCG